MTYTLARAIEDIEGQLGAYTGSNWQMKDLIKIRYTHPFSDLPIRSWFHDIRDDSGN